MRGVGRLGRRCTAGGFKGRLVIATLPALLFLPAPCVARFPRKLSRVNRSPLLSQPAYLPVRHLSPARIFPMPRPISASISRSALAHNLEVVRHRFAAARLAGSAPTRLWAVIKANAYGHGIERAVAAFSRADGLAMIDLAEAARCRDAGWVGPILLLEGLFEAADLEFASRYHLTMAVHGEDQLRMLELGRVSRPVDVFLKLNSGMNRLGFTPARYLEAYTRLLALGKQGPVATIGHMTHFATADAEAGIADQLSVFRATTAGLAGPVSLCNSAASLRYPETGGDWARPGVALYGATPFDGDSAASFGLQPAMRLQSALIGVQDIAAGSSVGYGATFRADTPMRIGIVACGYADGYPRHAGTGAPIVVDGVRTRLLGRVSMDMLAVDLTPVPQARVGSRVTLWGADGLSVDEVARAAGTIGYELMCAVAQRVAMRTEA